MSKKTIRFKLIYSSVNEVKQPISIMSRTKDSRKCLAEFNSSYQVSQCHWDRDLDIF